MRTANPELHNPVNPFPLIPDLGGAATLLPAKAYWFPGQQLAEFDDLALFCSHESVHLALFDTPLMFSFGALIQAQYIAISIAMAEGHHICIPSLREPTGILVQTRASLAPVDPVVGLIQELMATTLVPAFAEAGLILVTAHLWRDMHNGLVVSQDQFKDLPPIRPRDEDHFDALHLVRVDSRRVRNWQRTVSEITKAWLPTYSRTYGRTCRQHLGASFSTIHARLLEAWKRIIRTGTQDVWPELLLSLARYPFEVETPMTVEYGSLGDAVDGICESLLNAAADPARRLKRLVSVVRKGPGSASDSTWHTYLSKELPGFGQWTSGSFMLQAFAAQVWEAQGFVGLARTFQALYVRPYEAIPILTLPPFQAAVPESTAAVLTLESIRQSLQTCRPLPCLCTTDARAACTSRGVLAQAEAVITADDEYREWFSENWRVPECLG